MTRRQQFAAGCVLAVLLLFAQAGVADDEAVRHGPARQAGRPIGLIDVAYIFKHHPSFKRQMEEMKADLQKAEETFRARAADVTEMVGGLAVFKVGTPEYAQLEKEIAAQRAELQKDMEACKKEFTVRESRIYHETYREIASTVADYAQARGLGAVLRYQQRDVDAEDASHVMRLVNSRVVWLDEQCDITLPVLRQIVDKSSDSDASAETPPQGN